MGKRSVAIIGTRGYPSYYGGFETAVRHLAPFLADQGWNVTVYGRKNATADAEADPRIRRRVTPGIESKSVSTLSYGLTSMLDAAVRKPDVALVMNVANGFFLPALRVRGIPTLVNVDGIEWDREKWGATAKRMFLAGAKATAKHADQLVFDAEAIGDRWRRDFSVKSGVFIPYGGDDPGELPVEPGLEHGSYVLAVARFVPENTIEEFLEASSQLARETKVVLVGSTGYGGELDERAQQLAEREPNFLWLGHLKDDRRLNSLWQHAGAYFHGHSVGGTNPALVQAMACGAPIVARDTIYNREVLGTAAVFVEPTPSEITTGIRRLLTDPARQATLGAEARQRAAQAYSWHGVNSAYERALVQVIEGRR
ncbi:glycosyltransferase [Frigoribacterium faeni]|uniref:glycosyltransferase n=1 Tax=Frigoribacterium faeni TaxID=145483 RepID=UPI001FAD7977|nr:glycosyltransferase [Frigoribacterium faeni]MCJ0700454.1 glycosyltransferase [Frigoribacterium faeni]